MQSEMESPGFSESEFALGHCPRCERDVLTHVDYADGAEQRRCVHCDGPVDNGLRQVKGADLPAKGYLPFDPGGGCGSGGCGSGGCGRP